MKSEAQISYNKQQAGDSDWLWNHRLYLYSLIAKFLIAK